MIDDLTPEAASGNWLRHRLDLNHMEYAVVTVPGPPKAKPRPRVANGRAYTPRKHMLAEDLIAWHLKPLFKEPLTDPVGVGLAFYVGTERRIDCDNLAKTVLDAGNGICWADDSQVRRLFVTVDLDRENPRTVIVIGAL